MTLSWKDGYGLSIVATNGKMNAYFDSQTNLCYIKNPDVSTNKYMVGARNAAGSLALSPESSLPAGANIVQPSWGGSTSATATLAVADWSNNSQTVNVTGVTANNNVIVAPAPASQADYTSSGILCTAQGAGTLTFTCTTTPSNAITVNVLIV